MNFFAIGGFANALRPQGISITNTTINRGLFGTSITQTNISIGDNANISPFAQIRRNRMAIRQLRQLLRMMLVLLARMLGMGMMNPAMGMNPLMGGQGQAGQRPIIINNGGVVNVFNNANPMQNMMGGFPGIGSAGMGIPGPAGFGLCAFAGLGNRFAIGGIVNNILGFGGGIGIQAGFSAFAGGGMFGAGFSSGISLFA